MTMVLAASAMLLGGCDGSADGWSGTIETLPDGRVRVTNPAQGIWAEGQPWTLVQDLALGEIEGEKSEVFGQIAAIEVDDAGRIYVLDRQANELRIFAPDGSHVRTVGRAGSGPGEYRNANGLLWIAPDSLLVIDQRGRRYSLLTKEGDFVRSVPRSLGFYGWVAFPSYQDGKVYELSSVYRGEISLPALLGTLLASNAVNGAETGATEAAKSSGVTVPSIDTVMLPVSDRPAYQAFSVRTERASMVMSVPFAARAIQYVDGFGNVWHGHGSEFRIFRSTLAGDTTLEITVAATPVPVAPEELQEWGAGEAAKQFRELGGDLDMSRIPKTKPYFDEFYVDPKGHVWISTPAAAGETAFAVLDSDGRYLGRLELPGIQRESRIAPVVRNGSLYLAGRDELDVPRVFRFRIEKS